MSNLIVNWKVWRFRLQVVRPSDWRGELRMGRSPVNLIVYPRN